MEMPAAWIKERKCTAKVELDIPEICIYFDSPNHLTMADINPSSKQENWLEEPKKIPDTLNVLTILSFIGCGLQLLGSLWAFISAQSSYDTLNDPEKMEKLPSWARGGPDAVEDARKFLENKVPVLLLGLVAIALCLFGAIQMRQWKKSGFTFYTIGELLPFLTGYIFIGQSTVVGGRAMIGVVIAAVFIILYATQLKHLKK
jgi:hypothetical protein